jgi:hypothetical protein
MFSLYLSHGMVNELQLLLLNRGGEEIYVGPLGNHASKLIKYFEVGQLKVQKHFYCSVDSV